jgi:hypothetical protein
VVAITDPELLARQLMSDEEFHEHLLALAVHFPAREWTQASFEHGLRYPWSRPERSYLLRGGHTTLLHELDPAERAGVLASHVQPAADRTPLLAFGSNAAPKNLALKLAHHESPADREVLVLAGHLDDLDVVATASVATYGAMPATLAASAGTSVRAAVMLVTATQLTTLTWGEVPYRIGRLNGARFTVEDGVEGVELGSPLAFVARWGAFAPDGEAAALAAIPAKGRGNRAWTQRELVERAADIVLGPDGGGAEALTRLGAADLLALADRALVALRPYAQPFGFPGWQPIAADGSLERAA